MDKIALALEARMRPMGAPLVKVIASDEPAIVIEIDPRRSVGSLIYATLDSTGFEPAQLSSLLHFVADAIGEGEESGKIEKAYQDETDDGGDGITLSPEAEALQKELRERVAKIIAEDPDPFDGDAPASRL